MKRLGEPAAVPSVALKDAAFPAPFASGLEFSPPARGGWTIVHVGMLLPEAHEIFVCAAGCLRGVVLSAAEMNLTDRFSTVAVEEHNVTDGDMEELVVEGVTDILRRLPKRPKAVLLYFSCIHHFMGCDMETCCRTLRERFPDVDFTDCHMTPTMRKSGLSPDQIMRRQLYSLLKPREKDEKRCAIVGNCFSLDESSDLIRLIRGAGRVPCQITDCRTYEDYQAMAGCGLCVTTQSVARAAGDALAQRLGIPHLYLPVSCGSGEIRRNLTVLADALGAVRDDDAPEEAAAEAALRQAKQQIGDTPVAVDYTFTPRPLSLIRLLISHGFRVRTLFADAFGGEEKEDWLWLRENAPELTVYPTVHASMRRFSADGCPKTLALGQKAAYFTDTPYFVNLVEYGGLYGFDGIRRLAGLMTEAFAVPKDTAGLIQQKGLGCESCL